MNPLFELLMAAANVLLALAELARTETTTVSLTLIHI